MIQCLKGIVVKWYREALLEFVDNSNLTAVNNSVYG